MPRTAPFRLLARNSARRPGSCRIQLGRHEDKVTGAVVHGIMNGGHFDLILWEENM
jgi:hypothetical protein